MRAFSFLTGGLAALPLLFSPLPAADWSRWRGPSGDGHSPEVVQPESWSKEGPRVAWRARVGVGFSAVTVAAGRAYTLGNVDKVDTATLWCLDAASGRPVWKREWPSPLKPTMYEGGPNASAVVEGNRLYAVIKPARLVCLEAATGESIWETDLAGQAKAELSDWGVVSSPVIAGDLLLLNYGSLGSAFDARTGRLKWITGPGQAGFNSPVVARRASPRR